MLDAKVILTCGGRLTGGLAGRAPGNVKALLAVSGRTLLEAAVSAVMEAANPARNAGAGAKFSVAGLVAVGSDEVEREIDAISQKLNPGLPVKFEREGGTVLDNIKRGIDALADVSANAILVVSPDLPFISGGALGGFIAAIPPDAGLAMPVVSKDDFMAEFPGAGNKFLRLAGGEVTLGSVMYITEAMVAKNFGLFQDAYNARKNPGKIAGMLGLGFALKFLSGRLSLADAEARIGALADGVVRGVLKSSPVLAYDVDDEENLAYAVTRMSLSHKYRNS